MMAAGSLHCSGYMQVGCDGGWTAEQRVLISFKRPISILSSLSPVHAVAPSGKFVGVELLNAARGNPSASTMPGPRTAGSNVMPSPLQSCAPPGGGSVANLSRHPFHTNPASQRRAKFVVSQNADLLPVGEIVTSRAGLPSLGVTD